MKNSNSNSSSGCCLWCGWLPPSKKNGKHCDDCYPLYREAYKSAKRMEERIQSGDYSYNFRDLFEMNAILLGFNPLLPENKW